MAAYADIDDLTARFPRALTAAEVAQVPTMLDDASFLLSVKATGLDAAVDGDPVIAQAAMLTTVAMTKRALQAQAAQQTSSPGVDQVSQQFGPYSTSVKYKTDDGSLWLYNSELEAVLSLLRGDNAAAVSMRSGGL